VKTQDVKLVNVSDLDKFVKKTYGRPYSFQQQNGCRNRGVVNVTVPIEGFEDGDNGWTEEEVLAEEGMGVKLKTWLSTDPIDTLKPNEPDWQNELLWERHFYPDIEAVFTDLHEKGLIESGEYVIDIDW